MRRRVGLWAAAPRWDWVTNELVIKVRECARPCVRDRCPALLFDRRHGRRSYRAKRTVTMSGATQETGTRVRGRPRAAHPPSLRTKGPAVTTKSDFSEEEWSRIVRAPFVAGLAISLADPSGPIEAAKESMATVKSATNPSSREQLVTEVALGIQAAVQQKRNPLRGYALRWRGPHRVVSRCCSS